MVGFPQTRHFRNVIQQCQHMVVNKPTHTCIYNVCWCVWLFCNDTPLWKCKAGLKMGCYVLGTGRSVDVFPYMELNFLFLQMWNWTLSFYEFQWSQWIHISVQGLKTKISWLLCIHGIDALASKDTCSCFCFSCCFILPLSPTTCSILIFTAFPSALGHIAWFWDYLGLIVWTMPCIKQ